MAGRKSTVAPQRAERRHVKSASAVRVRVDSGDDGNAAFIAEPLPTNLPQDPKTASNLNYYGCHPVKAARRRHFDSGTSSAADVNA